MARFETGGVLLITPATDLTRCSKNVQPSTPQKILKWLLIFRTEEDWRNVNILPVMSNEEGGVILGSQGSRSHFLHGRFPSTDCLKQISKTLTKTLVHNFHFTAAARLKCHLFE